MIETLLALLVAHVIADFVLQFDWIIEQKNKLSRFAAHIAIVGGTAVIMLGVAPPALLGLVVLTHAAFDAAKLWLAPRYLKPDEAFILDQGAHIGVIALAAVIWPHSFAAGIWINPPEWLGWTSPLTAQSGLAILAGIAGFVFATRAGAFFLAMFMSRFEGASPPRVEHKRLVPGEVSADQIRAGENGLPGGGAWIGVLERGLVFVFVLSGQFTAIGFLLAAKSILRFQHAADRSSSEYVIIGTLMSISWALAAGFATETLIQTL